MAGAVRAMAGAAMPPKYRWEPVMRTSSVLKSLSSLAVLAAACGAGAQALPAAPGQGVLPEIQVVAAMPQYPIKVAQARKVRGIYALSNGWTLDVTPDWRKVYADINGRGKVEMLPLSPDKFISADGNVAMEFNLGVDENDMVMRYRPDATVAQVIVVRATLARR
jgi:hypothetical protein